MQKLNGVKLVGSTLYKLLLWFLIYKEHTNFFEWYTSSYMRKPISYATR